MNIEVVRSLKQFALRVSVIEEEAIFDCKKPVNGKKTGGDALVISCKPHEGKSVTKKGSGRYTICLLQQTAELKCLGKHTNVF